MVIDSLRINIGLLDGVKQTILLTVGAVSTKLSFDWSDFEWSDFKKTK